MLRGALKHSAVHLNHITWLFDNISHNISHTVHSTEWPEDYKNRCLSSSKNSVGLHFHEGVEKIKENDKNTKIENLQNGREKYGGKNLAYVYSWGKSLKKNCNLFKF